jgi:hypothetical protein
MGIHDEQNSQGSVAAGGGIEGSNAVAGDRNTVSRNENQVTVNIDGPSSSSHRRGRLMPEVEQELRGSINQLTRTVYDFRQGLSDSLSELRSTVSANKSMTEQQIAAIERQIDSTTKQSDQTLQAIERQTEMMRKQFSSVNGLRIQDSAVAYVRPIPFWQPFLTPIILTVGFALLFWFLAYGGGGGG